MTVIKMHIAVSLLRRAVMIALAIAVVWMVTPESLFGQTGTPPQTMGEPSKGSPAQIMASPFEMWKTPSLISQATALTLLSLLPFIIMNLTAFVKIVVVLSLL